MKKVGIITHYYKSMNYGALLQAYALQKVISQMDYEVEQICYDMTVAEKKRGELHTVKQILRKGYNNLKHYRQFSGWKKRCRAFRSFEQSIPHSGQVYDRHAIEKANDIYDAFVTGSDQVWNTDWYHPAFFLDFVVGNKKKIAYAASLGHSEMNGGMRQIFMDSMKDYTAISVRESDAIAMVGECTPISVVKVLDPTLLLTKEQWDEICTDRIVKDDYIFCFLLGDGVQERKLAEEFARKKNLKLVTLPHFPRRYRSVDQNFGDVYLYDVSPETFLSLIKYAQVVLTDSFHAAVFSSTYEKEYFAFERTGAKNMGSRLKSLTQMFECEERFLCTPEMMTTEYIKNVEPISYNRSKRKIEKEREDSLNFLKRALGEINESKPN